MWDEEAVDDMLDDIHHLESGLGEPKDFILDSGVACIALAQIFLQDMYATLNETEKYAFWTLIAQTLHLNIHFTRGIN